MIMRFLFSVATLVFSVAFVAYGMATLDLYDISDRPGPGYFPLIIGVMLIIATSINVVKDFKIVQKLKADRELNEIVRKGHDSHYAKDAIVAVACLSLLIFTLNSLGAILSMVLFCLVFLSYFNQGKILQNTIYSIVFPASVYLLFDVWLQAGLPDGLLSAFN
ncbi:tripartite tricarboxylate transporter TctB family protein [Vibrio alginolyticus]|nr:tripartite tricarboxylate transporter TctB family protein [Vibrio alginolyticus]